MSLRKKKIGLYLANYLHSTFNCFDCRLILSAAEFSWFNGQLPVSQQQKPLVEDFVIFGYVLYHRILNCQKECNFAIYD
jgi:hypothetical protein